MNVVIDKEKIRAALTRAVERIYPSREALESAFMDGRQLKIYLGVDPTGSHLHLGHLTNLLVLKRFQELGHKVILLIGDFTARIGDPTDKLATRRPLTPEEVKENLRTFKVQASRVLAFRGDNPARVMFNAKWLSRMKLEDVMRLAEQVTVQQMIHRDMFAERIKTDKPIGLHEFLYPLLQGYDSVAMGVDMEIGGTDQTFNMLVGRDLAKALKEKEKFVLTTQLLEDPATGKKLMNKSEGGLINLDDGPNDMFGKVMALPDSAIVPVTNLSTDLPMDEVGRLKELAARDPRDAKLALAFAVVGTVYTKTAAVRAKREFHRVFSERQKPEEVSTVSMGVARMPLVDLLVMAKLASSKSEARRLIEQGGVKLDDVRQDTPDAVVELGTARMLQVGRHRFIKVVL